MADPHTNPRLEALFHAVTQLRRSMAGVARRTSSAQRKAPTNDAVGAYDWISEPLGGRGIKQHKKSVIFLLVRQAGIVIAPARFEGPVPLSRCRG